MRPGKLTYGIILAAILLSCEKEGWVSVYPLLPDEITPTSITCGGYVGIQDGENEILSCGVYYSLDSVHVASDPFVESTSAPGTGPFKCVITGLLPDTTYYLWPYAKTPSGERVNWNGMKVRTEWTVGCKGPAGGHVFYVDGNGGGMEVAPFDQAETTPWACMGQYLPTSESFFSGEPNTANILAGCTDVNSAAMICDDFVYNGYDDWFLPSRSELNQVKIQLYDNGIGNFNAVWGRYWSSSNIDADRAWSIYFPTGYQNTTWKTDTLTNVRAVRSF